MKVEWVGRREGLCDRGGLVRFMPTEGTSISNSLGYDRFVRVVSVLTSDVAGRKWSMGASGGTSTIL